MTGASCSASRSRWRPEEEEEEEEEVVEGEWSACDDVVERWWRVVALAADCVLGE